MLFVECIIRLWKSLNCLNVFFVKVVDIKKLNIFYFVYVIFREEFFINVWYYFYFSVKIFKFFIIGSCLRYFLVNYMLCIVGCYLINLKKNGLNLKVMFLDVFVF